MPYNSVADTFHRKKFVKRDFAPTRAGWPKISGRRCHLHQPFFFSENYARWSFAKYKNLDRFFFRFVTMHAFDRLTDRQTDRRTDRILIARPRLHSMQRGKNLDWFFFRLSQFTRLTDGRTDRILLATPRLHSMQRVSNPYIRLPVDSSSKWPL